MYLTRVEIIFVLKWERNEDKRPFLADNGVMVNCALELAKQSQQNIYINHRDIRVEMA